MNTTYDYVFVLISICIVENIDVGKPLSRPLPKYSYFALQQNTDK